MKMIHDDASIAPVDETRTAEDTYNTRLIDINETIAAFLTDADSQSQSTAPPTPSPVTPATETRAQFLKRNRGSSTPHKDLRQKDRGLAAYITWLASSLPCPAAQETKTAPQPSCQLLIGGNNNQPSLQTVRTTSKPSFPLLRVDCQPWKGDK